MDTASLPDAPAPDVAAANRRPRYDDYRDPGVAWLDDVPAHWETKPLKYAVTIDPEALGEKTNEDFLLRYADIGSVDLVEGIEKTEEYRFVDAPSRARKIVQDGDTIISTVRTYLRAVAYIDNPPDNMIVSTGFAVLRPKKDVLPEYLGYLISSTQFVDSAVAHSKGIGYPAINTTALGNLPVWLPPLAEQRAIAAYLDDATERIDRLVAQKERLLDLLDEKRTALVSEAVTRGLDPDAEMQDSGVEWLGEIPAGWETVKLKWNVSKIGSGVTPEGGGEAYVNEGVTFLRSQNIHFDGLRLEDAVYIDKETDAEMTGSRVRPRDVLLNITGASVGRCALVPHEFPDANVNQHVCIIRPRSDELHPPFLNCVLASSIGQHQIFAEQDGASREAVTFAEIGDFVIPKPPLPEQSEIASHLDRETARLDRLAGRVEDGIARLREYRAALISAAVTGRIDAREA
jgi:type I restriction enzyme S subunit